MQKYQNNKITRILVSDCFKVYYNEWKLNQRTDCDNIIIDQELVGKINILRLDNALKRFVLDNIILNSHVEDIGGELYWIKNRKILGLEYSKNKLEDSDISLYTQKPFDLGNGPLYRSKLIKNYENISRLIIVLPRILVDEFSLNYLINEISKYYNDEGYKNSTSTAEQLWSISKLSKRLAKHAIYKNSAFFWKEKLIDLEPLHLFSLKLNTKYILSNLRQIPGLSIQELSTAGEIRFKFDNETLDKIGRLKKSYKIKPYLFSQSILAILLNKYTDQDKFCIGYLTTTKGKKDYLYGAHANINLMPYDFSRIINVIDLINQSKSFSKSLKQGDINHGYLRASEILSLSNKELLNVSFVQRNLEDKVFNFKNIKASIKSPTNIELTSDLVFEQEIKNKEINYRIRYKSDKINSNLLSEFIICYKSIFIEILDELLKCKHSSELTHIKNYNLLSTEQYEQIIYTWNNTDKDCLDKAINELFEEQVERVPENIAVTFEKTSLKYKELNKRANRLARFLKQNYHINPDTLIALFLDRDEHMLIAILAVLKAGGAYVPMNTNYPDERVLYILEDTNTKLVLTTELHMQRMDAICKDSTNKLVNLSCAQVNKLAAIEILALDNIELQENLLLQSNANLDNSLIKSSNLAYVIYTSGTTGKPKGVMIEHRSYVSTIICMKNLYFKDKQQVSTYNITNYAFDMIGPEYGLPLFTGGTIFIGNNEFDSLDCSNYDFIQMTPTLCELKLDCLINTNHTKLLIGAESLSYDLLVKILNKSIDVVHLYGPTETTIWSTSKYYSCKENTKLLSVILGKPFDNEKVYVLNSNLFPLPIGAIGELYIGGIGLARGYLNKSDLTAERFIPNPFQTIEEKAKYKNTRLYKTGDLVRWLPDGNLEYIGRNDFQVKIRGYRIELGEIETTLSNYEGIKQSVVIAKEHLSNDGLPTGHKYLVGYYVSDAKLDEGRVSSYLQSRLPEYMVPNILMHLTSLPLTINGKLDKRSLPDPEFTSDHYIAPRNELESRLCNIWAEILGLPKNKVGITEDFFRLGGDSILAIRLVGKINKDFNTQIKVKEIFELRCISKLMEIITAKNDNDKEEKIYIPFSLVKKEDYENIISEINLIEDIYPASYLQVEMLLASDLDTNGAYHNVSSYSVHTKFDKHKLLTIFKNLFSKHELLRAGFILNNHEDWYVVVFKEIKIDCLVYRNQNSKEIIAEEKSNNFDYTKPGLFRLIVNDFGNNFDLMFSFHHAIEDGWSMASLVNDFGHAYINNKPIETNIDLRYGEFIRNELDAMKNQDVINFWKGYLNDLNITKLNWKHDEINSQNTLSFTFKLNVEQVRLIHTISRESKISVDSVFLFTYLKVLSYFTNSSDITVGVVVNNRLEKNGGEKLFGLFLNIIPFRFNFNNQKDTLDELLSLFNNKLKLQHYQQLPYGYIKSLFQHELYEFVFTFVHLHILSESVKSIEPVDGYERTKIPFNLTVVQKGDYALLVNINVNDGFISKDFLDCFILNYKECLSSILKDLDHRI